MSPREEQLAMWVEALVAEMEHAVDIFRNPNPGGQQAGHRSSWMRIQVPSQLREYEWHVRELRAALNGKP